jgi:predicted dehydrogenase
MTNDSLKVGVIGVGHLGKFHTRIYQELPNVELVGVADINPKMKSIARKHKTKFYEDYKELIKQVDAVSIVVPTSLHYEVGKVVLEAGVHALIEKPITDNLEQADELLELARQKNLTLQVGHIERFNAGFRAVKDIAEKVRFIEIHRLGPFTGRINDCGVVLDLMIHDLDIVLGLMNSKITYLDVVGINVLTAHEDIANVRVRFENGCVVNITASRMTPKSQRKIRIFQENAYISLDYEKQSAQIFTRKNGKIHHDSVNIKKEEPLKAELIEFVSLVTSGRGHGKPDVGARNALELAIRITEDIKKNSPKMPSEQLTQ